MSDNVLPWYRRIFSRAVAPASRSIHDLVITQQRPPRRDVGAVLNAFETNPRLWSVISTKADAVASAKWTAFRGTPESIAELRALSPLRHVDPYAYLKKRADVLGRQQAVNSSTLALLHRASPELTGHQIRATMQTTLDLVGEAIAVIEPNGLGSLVNGFLYPLNPEWATPPARGKSTWTLSGGGFSRLDVPSERIFAMKQPRPSNPYDRGLGLGQVLSSEIDVDEYAATAGAGMLYNNGMPPFLVRLDTPDKADVEAFKTRWLNDRRGGPERVNVPMFTNAKELQVEKLGVNLADMDLIDTRRYAAEVIRETPRLPPEILGHLDNSNRATIDAAHYLFAALVVTPALQQWEDALNDRLAISLKETGVFLAFESPVPSDRDFILDVMAAHPEKFTDAEIRQLAGYAAKPVGEVFTDDEDADETNEVDDAETTSNMAPEDGKVEDVQKTALNGAQVQAASQIVKDVAAGLLPRDSGVAQLELFFQLSHADAETIMGTVGKTFEPAMPEPAPAAPAAPPSAEPKA